MGRPARRRRRRDRHRQLGADEDVLSPTRALVAAPVAAAAALLGLLAAVDPNQPGHYPTCPFLLLTGHYCPGCGSLRALHALAVGHLADAVSRNALTIVALPLLAWLWLRWSRGLLRGAPPPPLPAPAIRALLAVTLVFAVARNLPIGAALAP